MAHSTKKPADTGYPIGVVARLTGIQPTTLRIWERRYGLVEPVRSEGRNRRYSDADIQRLSLIKTLVDAGHQISSIAPLTMKQLQARLESTSIQTLTSSRGETKPCRVVVLGSALPERIRNSETHAAELELVGSFADEDALLRGGATLAPDVLIMECATIQNDALGKVRRLLAASGARQGVVIYSFGTRQALDGLGAAGVACLRAPAAIADVVRACRSVQAPLSTALAGGTPVLNGTIPSRRFSNEQLARISGLMPAIACECPHHLVDLINSLSAFETYSRECQNKNDDDAEIHAYLYQMAARSRDLLEAGLQRVVEFEGLTLAQAPSQ